MLKKYIHISFFFLLLVALAGVWMRFFPFHPDMPVPYHHILHGHSHLALLGWAFLGVFLVFVLVLKPADKAKKQAASICFSLAVVTTLMFLAFLYQGYGGISIAFSAIHLFIEFWAVFFIYGQCKGNPLVGRSAFLFVMGAFISLSTSSLGTFSVAYVSANDLKDTPFYDMGVYFYLHFLYNGWFSLFIFGMFVILFRSKGIKVNEFLLQKGFWLYFIALFPGYFSSILWIENLGWYADAFSFIGLTGQWIGVLLILLAFYQTWGHIKDQYAKGTVFLLAISFTFIFVKSTLELGLAIPNLADLVYTTRNVIIGYLHWTLLGAISVSILTQFHMINVLEFNAFSKGGRFTFLSGVILNEAILFVDSLFSWIGIKPLPFVFEGLLFASALLTVGVFLLWLSRDGSHASLIGDR